MRTEALFSLEGKRVWVAGHRGMAGAAVVRRLEREPCELITVGRDRVDLRRQAEVEDWMAEAKPDAVFVAAATDNLIRAIDLATGKTLWSDVLPAGGQATPMTYEANGKQYIVIYAGGHHFMETPVGDEVVAYALP